MKIYVLVLAAATLLGRVFIVPRLTHIPTVEGTYEALAHMLVGFLVLAPFYDRRQQLGPSKLYGWIGWGLAFWELGFFLVQKLGTTGARP
jgi:hypothetical protein